MAIAQIGPLTAVIEALATAVGAGSYLAELERGSGDCSGVRCEAKSRARLFSRDMPAAVWARRPPWSTRSYAMVLRGEVICLHRDMKQSVRYANIGIGVGTLIAFVGAFTLRGLGEDALHLVGLAAFFGGLAVYFALEERARKRRQPPQ